MSPRLFRPLAVAAARLRGAGLPPVSNWLFTEIISIRGAPKPDR